MFVFINATKGNNCFKANQPNMQQNNKKKFIFKIKKRNKKKRTQIETQLNLKEE